MKLLMLCHFFSLKEPVFFELLCTELLSAQHTSSIRYFSSGIHPRHFGIKTTREFVAHVFPPLKSGEAPQKDVRAKDQLDGWENVREEVEKVVHHQARENAIKNCSRYELRFDPHRQVQIPIDAPRLPNSID